jgi:hypothetical protein
MNSSDGIQGVFAPERGAACARKPLIAVAETVTADPAESSFLRLRSPAFSARIIGRLSLYLGFRPGSFSPDEFRPARSADYATKLVKPGTI